MSYNTRASHWGIDNVSKDDFDNLNKMIENQGVRVEGTEEDNGKEVPYSFRDDCSGVIYDWAKKYKLSFSYRYHDEEEDTSKVIEFIDGVEQDA